MGKTSNLLYRKNKYYILQFSSFMKLIAKVAVYQAFKHEFFANFFELNDPFCHSGSQFLDIIFYSVYRSGLPLSIDVVH